VKRFVSFGKYADDVIDLSKEVAIEVGIRPRPPAAIEFLD